MKKHEIVCFNGKIVQTRLFNRNKDEYDIKNFLSAEKENINKILLKNNKKKSKVIFNLKITLVKQDGENIKYFQKTIENDPFIIRKFTEKKFKKILKEQGNKFLSKIDDFNEQGSNWSLGSINFLEVYKCVYNSLKGSSGNFHYPDFIKNKRACVDPQTKIRENKTCFLDCLHIYFYLKDHPKHSAYKAKNLSKLKREIINRKYNLKFNLKDMPMSLDRLKKFEKQNKMISLFVYGVDEEEKEIYGPVYTTVNQSQENVIHLLFLENNDENHFMLIKDLSRLLKSQISKHKAKIHLCHMCFTKFHSIKSLKTHQVNGCEKTIRSIPDKGTKIFFKNISNQLPVPFNIFADFECFVTPFDFVKNNPESSFSVPIQKHIPFAYSFLFDCYFDNQLNEFYCHVMKEKNENVAKTFVEDIMGKIKQFYEKYILNPKYTELKVSKKERKSVFKKNINFPCVICGGPLGYDTKQIVIDHCHFTNNINGLAHNFCNLQYKIKKEVNVFFHNHARYDIHLYIEELCKYENNSKLNIIAKTSETYLTLSKTITLSNGSQIQVNFKDSLSFLSESLESLADNLLECEFINTKDKRWNLFPNENIDENMLRKGLLPYNFIQNLESLDFPGLPPSEWFSKGLNKGVISESELIFAHKLFFYYQCKTLRDYLIIYLKFDVLILSDAFNVFRETCLSKNTHGLDVSHYVSISHFSFDAMLKNTGIELELLHDSDMVDFIKKGIRGGISQCSIKHLEAQNMFTHPNDDIEDPSFILYLDFNSLYGLSMLQFLPTSEFEWLNENELTSFTRDKILSLSDEEEIGYIFEANVQYPNNLHDLHNNLPFLPESIKIKNTSRLCATLYDKKNYVVHYRNLRQALEHGLHLEKIIRGLKFKQSPFLRDFVTLNTNLRINAPTKARSNAFKLCINGCFGRFLLNKDKYTNFHLKTHFENDSRKFGISHYINSPLFKRLIIFNENLIGIESYKKTIKFDVPIIVGFCILESSKFKLYDFYYNYIMKRFPRSELAYVDTDSYIFKTYSNNIFEDLKNDIKNDKIFFDNSNYSDSVLEKYDFNKQLNKNKLGAIKDELGGEIIKSYTGLSSKVYAISTLKNDEMIKKCKGISRDIVQKKISRQDYLNCVYNKDLNIILEQKIIQSKKHVLYTEIVNKVGLTSKDTKRHLLEDRIHTLALGHKNI